MATTPSPMFIGVQRVVIACAFDAGLTEAERRSVCEQLVGKAKVHTSLPVAVATAADLDPMSGELAKQSEQLILKVSGRAVDVDPGRKSLSLAVTPVRLASEGLALPAAQKSNASLVKVQGKWIVQGPIAAFEKLLGGSRSKSLRAPIRSDK